MRASCLVGMMLAFPGSEVATITQHQPGDDYLLIKSEKEQDDRRIGLNIGEIVSRHNVSWIVPLWTPFNRAPEISPVYLAYPLQSTDWPASC